MDLTNFPSIINADGAHASMSDRYAFIPTTRVLNVLAGFGWLPAKAEEARTRMESKVGFQKHLIRLRNDRFVANAQGYFPEILIRNAHNGASSFELSGGVWRLVCSNGLCIGETYGIHRIKHIGFAESRVEDAARLLIEEMPKVLGSIDSFRSIELTRPEQEAFARTAIELKHDPEDDTFKVEPHRVLEARRWDDKSNDLWSTYNRVQEHLIKGGTRGTSANGRRRRDRGVTSIDRNVGINRALWTLTERMAAIKGGTAA